MLKNMLKDQVLDILGCSVNVAQFASFSPNGSVRHCRIRDFKHSRHSAAEILQALFASSREGSVNIRTFREENAQGNPFVFGVRDMSELSERIREFLALGYYVIASETLSLDDGGVSGVIQNEIIEFTPGITPRDLENSKSPVPILPQKLGLDILSRVYGIADMGILKDRGSRIEFSIHPESCGCRNEKIIVWEFSPSRGAQEADIFWPNGLSRLIGDKAYGLLMADAMGYAVPLTEVYVRNKKIDPFSFGSRTGAAFKFTRTCPKEPVPGKYATLSHYYNPYKLMEKDDPLGQDVVSCLIQDAITPSFSGSCVGMGDGKPPLISGVAGFGNVYMEGKQAPEDLPGWLFAAVIDLYLRLKRDLGKDVSFEWVFDLNKKPYIVQLHVLENNSLAEIDGDAAFRDCLEFDAGEHLDALRELSKRAAQEGKGIRVIGNVGITSHIADILRNSGCRLYVINGKAYSKQGKGSGLMHTLQMLPMPGKSPGRDS